MKQISLIINSVLIVCIGILFYMNIATKIELKSVKADLQNQKKIEQKAAFQSSIAYVNIDSLILNYRLSEDLNYDIKLKQEKARTELGDKYSKFEQEYNTFQDKLNRGGFLTRERAEEEQQRLLEKQQALQALESNLSNDLMTQQQIMNQQLYDSISNFLKEFNTDYGFDYILGASTGGGILYATQDKNYTDTVLKTLNSRYLVKKKERK